MAKPANIYSPPVKTQYRIHYWTGLQGSSTALALLHLANSQSAPVLVAVPSAQQASELFYELRFFNQSQQQPLPVWRFPEWETLPYDVFSPHQDIISERLTVLNALQQKQPGIYITSIPAMMNRLPPTSYVMLASLSLQVGQQLDMEHFRDQLQQAGYRAVEQVIEHGEFAIRGGIMDLFPMGSEWPYRIELFDDEIDTLRTFDVETQRSHEHLQRVQLLPAKEVPLTHEAIQRFRTQWRDYLPGNPIDCPLYQEVSQGVAPPGIEYYLPLFFEQTATLLDYLPEQSLLVAQQGCHQQAQHFWSEIERRYEQLRYDRQRPILPPATAFVPETQLFQSFKDYQQIALQDDKPTSTQQWSDFAVQALPDLTANYHWQQPLQKLKEFLQRHDYRVLFCVETAGRQEVLQTLLADIDVHVTVVDDWQDFLNSQSPYCLAVYPIERGFCDTYHGQCLITEAELWGRRIMQRRRRKRYPAAEGSAIKDLSELKHGDPVVHTDHGVGRYAGLQTLEVGGIPADYMVVEYAEDAKLYVPIESLPSITRYTGGDIESAPLHKLGGKQWEKAKSKAAKKVRDVAAELLEIYAQRAARQGHAFDIDRQYTVFASQFPFEETPDQAKAIEAVLEDLQSSKPMDRLVCGDVGFGKTEVAMRAAFVVAFQGRQVAVLAPTTLLVQQHWETFRDRFADWPINIAVLSRFNTAKEQTQILHNIRQGKVDIIIGTHKLLSKELKFDELGLLVIDEEHRFGVKQKEHLKSLRASIDILTLTATPIPRTLNMAFSGIRDLSIIATPPARRLSVKTFVRLKEDEVMREAILREILRGGQVFVVHNNVQTINRTADQVSQLVDEANVAIAHGQMAERELERVMTDFYHRRYNVLVTTTIIETGIDIPSANTIIIDRADRFGLAQLHQLRGRVGRSHHQAYAYLLTPHPNVMTKDAKKRLEAISSLDSLGSGFMLATQDLEIRGAGELLGEGQSGQMQEVGFQLYMDMLERAVEQMKQGQSEDHLDLEQPAKDTVKINLAMPTLIPEDYLADVNQRLVLYKRIANAQDIATLNEIQVEMRDRFGPLPEAVQNLLRVSGIKLKAHSHSIIQIDAQIPVITIEFNQQPPIDPQKLLQWVQQHAQSCQFTSSTSFKIWASEHKVTDDASLLQFIEHLLSADVFNQTEQQQAQHQVET